MPNSFNSKPTGLPSKPSTSSSNTYSDGSPSVLPATNNVSGKRTYADSVTRPQKLTPVLPLSLQHINNSTRRRRYRSVGSRDSTPSKLFRRAIGEDISWASFLKIRFNRLQLKQTLHTNDPALFPDQFTSNRARLQIIEVVSNRDLIFSLTQSGVCAAYSRDLASRICYLNICHDEVIRSLFVNTANDSLITVSVFRKDDYSSLHCRSIPLAHIRKGNLKSAMVLFKTESLKWPGFVEFDDVNGKILTFSAQDKKFKVWCLQSYNLLYSISDDRIDEVKISPGILLLIYNRAESHIPIRILDIATGKCVRDMNHLVNRKRKIDFIEQFGEKLLVKAENENLQIIDVVTGEIVEVERSNFLRASSFISLYESQQFLTVQNCDVKVWNFCGQHVNNFEDHTLFGADTLSSCVYITKKQDIIISYCHQEHEECTHGTINISEINTGKLLGKITCDPDSDMEHIRALDDVTCLHYNEERDEIYSGSVDGNVIIWSV